MSEWDIRVKIRGTFKTKVELPKNELQNFTKILQKNYKNLEKSSNKSSQENLPKIYKKNPTKWNKGNESIS